MYQVKINEFEGPLDLLLHLIKKDNIDIYDINIKDITEQYLNYINEMEELNLNIASEYLVMAAELIELKSRMLLPNEDIEEDEEEIKTKEKLINKLLDYQKYKEMVPKLKDLEEKRSNFYTKTQSDLREYNDGQMIIQGDITLSDLLEAYAKFLERKNKEKPLATKITKKEYDVKVREKQIKDVLRTKKKVKFEELFDVNEKSYIVVTFLAILELAKKQELYIKQSKPLDQIYLSLEGEVWKKKLY